MPPQRRPRTRRSRNTVPNPAVPPDFHVHAHATPDPLPLALDVPQWTTNSVEETKTEPTTPTSPTLHTQAYRRRALRRERSARLVNAVLHYDRAENDLQPWYW
jgi:hypothetical protein